MALNEHRRQKKLQAKRTQRKTSALRKRERQQEYGLFERTEAAGKWPIVLSRVAANLWEDGIGEAVLIRQAPNGSVAMVQFLLDVYCLGVKTVNFRFESSATGNDFIDHAKLNTRHCIDVPPEHVCKLVEESIGYALSLGIAPHAECAALLKVFGDLDSSRCSQQFEFGQDGQPLFVAGPFDSVSRIRHVLQALLRTCGPGGFHYLIPTETPSIFEELKDLIDISNRAVLEISEDDEE